MYVICKGSEGGNVSYILTKLYVQFASSTFLWESGKPGVWLKSTHVMTRQTPESVNHVTFQIFSKQQLSEMYTAAKKKKKKKGGQGTFRKKDFTIFNTHRCPRSASVHPPSSPICHSQRAYDAAIWEAEIIRREGRRHSEGGWS